MTGRGAASHQQLVFFYMYFYQVLRVLHCCSSTQSWGSVLPSIVEMRYHNSRDCPQLFLNRGLFCAWWTGVLYAPLAFGKLWTTQGVICMKHGSSSPMSPDTNDKDCHIISQIYMIMVVKNRQIDKMVN